MSMEDFIISVYCLVDEMLKLVAQQKLRQRGFEPKLSDSEVITMGIVAEFFRIDTDKGTWEYFSNHWLSWFPNLGSRANFAKHAANLWAVKQKMQKMLAKELGSFSDQLHLCDGFPMPVCHFKRAHFSSIFKGEAAFGYCASKGERYYGFKGNVLINSEGTITDITITPANIDERESLWDIAQEINGILVADKGLIGSEYQNELRQFTGINLQTAVCSNMKEERSEKLIKWLGVDTTFGRNSYRPIDRPISHREGTSPYTFIPYEPYYKENFISHSRCVYRKRLGNPPLQFDLLVQP